MREHHRHRAAPGRTSAAILAAAAIALAAWLVAGVGSAGAGPIKSASNTVHVIEHAVTDTEVPSGGGKDVTGNPLTFHNKVYNVADKTVVGHDQGVCTRIDPKEGSWECAWTTFVAGGQITVEGPYYDTKNSILAITGGTGAYRDARGQMNLNSRDGGKEYDFVFHIDR